MPRQNKLPRRMWVNQPSTQQPHHASHGQNVLAIHEYGDTYRVYPVSGDVLSVQMSGLCLSEGWVETPLRPID